MRSVNFFFSCISMSLELEISKLDRKVYQIIIPLAKGCISSNQLRLMGCFVVGSILGIDAKGK